jgi:hypothetical protein
MSQTMGFKIDPEFKARHRKLTPDEYSRLSIKIELEGCQPGALAVGVVGSEKYLIDGHNTLSICKEKGLKWTEPRFMTFPNRESILEWIDDHQRARRNLSPEDLAAMAARRRERVVEARDEGKSTRAIAEQEGVSETQVRRDLEASGAPPGAPGSETGKITGKDGKSYPAPKQVTCERCQRTGPVKGCQKCADLLAKAGKKPPKPPRPKKPSSVKFDFKEYDKHLGSVVRGIDDLKRAYPEVARTDEFVEIECLRDGYVKTWKKLQRMATKMKE